jgi:hypothetical protein
MTDLSPDEQAFRVLIRERIGEGIKECLGEATGRIRVEALGIIIAGQLVEIASHFAIRAGIGEEGIIQLARGCYEEALTDSKKSAGTLD